VYTLCTLTWLNTESFYRSDNFSVEGLLENAQKSNKKYANFFFLTSELVIRDEMCQYLRRNEIDGIILKNLLDLKNRVKNAFCGPYKYRHDNVNNSNFAPAVFELLYAQG